MMALFMVSELETIGQIGSIGTAIATVALVFLFWKTIQQLEETVKVSRIQTTHRFRPWVGPSDGIKQMSVENDREQFSITVKNYGEIPSSNVVVSFSVKNQEIKREMIRSDRTNDFALGPLLPNMEKRYWFFIDSDLIGKARSGEGQLFISLYFGYEHQGGKSGYNMISHFDAKTDTFVHKDMWVD